MQYTIQDAPKDRTQRGLALLDAIGSIGQVWTPLAIALAQATTYILCPLHSQFQQTLLNPRLQFKSFIAGTSLAIPRLTGNPSLRTKHSFIMKYFFPILCLLSAGSALPYDVSQSSVGKCGNKQGQIYGGDGCCKVPLTYDYNRGRESGGTRCDDPWWTPGHTPP